MRCFSMLCRKLAHARVDHGVDGAGGHDVDPDTVSDELDGAARASALSPPLEAT